MHLFFQLFLSIDDEGNSSTEMLEYWHRGDHSDVGGGHALQEAAISFEALQHMLEECPLFPNQPRNASILRAALGLDELDAGESVPDLEAMTGVATEIHGPNILYPVSYLFGSNRYGCFSFVCFFYCLPCNVRVF
jgi:hypothetical protein